jgi:death-on-curing protein
MEPKWISKKSTLAIHEALLAEHGGAPGFVAEHLVDSALDSPRNHFAHGVSDLFELAAAYARGLTQDHPFVDGNKRVALTVALTFLERNGVIITASEAEAVQMVLGLSTREVDASAVAEWLRNNSEKVRRSSSRATKKRTAKKVIRVVKKRK